MYICLCNAITDQQIRQVAKRKSCTMKCIMKELGVATQCGKCARQAQQILWHTREQLQLTTSNPIN